MFHTKITPNGGIRAINVGEITLRAFLSAHHKALGHAAVLLADRRGARLINAIRDGLCQPGPLTRRLHRLLLDLHGLLFLEHVDNDDWGDAGGFAMLDPEDPIAPKICLLADGKFIPNCETGAFVSSEAELWAFLVSNIDAPSHAAVLFAGCRGAKVVNAIRGELDQPGPLMRPLRHHLIKVPNILFLQHNPNDDWNENGFLALLKTEDPPVGKICLLADGIDGPLLPAGLQTAASAFLCRSKIHSRTPADRLSMRRPHSKAQRGQ